MRINTPRDGQTSIDDQKPFVESNDVTTSDSNVAAFTIEGPEGYVIGIEEGTPVAPEFRTESGQKIDGSARVTIQKCDKQGNPIGSGIVFTELMSRFDYEKFRTDPDFFRKSDRDLMIDEREIVKEEVELLKQSEVGRDLELLLVHVGLCGPLLEGVPPRTLLQERFEFVAVVVAPPLDARVVVLLGVRLPQFRRHRCVRFESHGTGYAPAGNKGSQASRSSSASRRRRSPSSLSTVSEGTAVGFPDSSIPT